MIVTPKFLLWLSFVTVMTAPAATPIWSGEVPLKKGVAIHFVNIASGQFLMGAKNGCYDGLPIHEVQIRTPFWMAKTEITQQQYLLVMEGENAKAKRNPLLPMTNISWHEAMAFCKKLTVRERKAKRIPSKYKFTLPSEAQWEYACRAGSTGTFAGNLNRLGWYKSNSGGRVQLVGRKQPNAWGLYDMHGNVWEWCLDDWHPNYIGAPRDGVAWEQGHGAERPLRGGAWFREAIFCRSAARFHRRPAEHSRSIGFRPVLSPIH